MIAAGTSFPAGRELPPYGILFAGCRPGFQKRIGDCNPEPKMSLGQKALLTELLTRFGLLYQVHEARNFRLRTGLR